ncbi:hypothetical protein FHS27_006532 [Rhodopirellula rubra]|uniref:Uncharacterized protein n=1 Tax=Aporhodopirellula rubra TaxID=980271 RepID=A0A7W5H9Q8_9BACT|nr:hypothetical protein [Aporhodopirellula rubra]MBB3210684.1 hypothetical protein [Aporhodopirellula rubra]
MPDPESLLRSRVEQLEAQLLRQEHRLIPLVKNFLDRKQKYPNRCDARRKATTRALLFNLLLSPQTMALGGGMLAFVSVLILAYQSHLMQQTVYPTPRYTAIIRPLVSSNAYDTTEIAFPDLAIEKRDFEFAFTANGAGPLLIDTVNLKIEYVTEDYVPIRTDYFESRSSGVLPVVGKSSIETCKVTFKRFGHAETNAETSPPGPIRPVFTFAVGGVDSDGKLWSTDIRSVGVIIDDGRANGPASDLYLTGSGESLNGVLQPRSVAQTPEVR